jgi:hypothetical protein
MPCAYKNGRFVVTEARRRRAATGVANGKSQREIASEEGVSPTTIREDLQTSESGHPRPPEQRKNGHSDSENGNISKNANSSRKVRDELDEAGKLVDALKKPPLGEQ